MINKKMFEEEILINMNQSLSSPLVKSASSKLETAVEYLNSAAEIFEDMGLIKNADEVLNVLTSIAKHKKPKNPTKVFDRHTKGLTPDKMVKNLLDHGTEFNMADDGQVDDLLNLDINDADLEVLEDEILSDMDFEDEV
jgi:hypothetical protein